MYCQSDAVALFFLMPATENEATSRPRHTSCSSVISQLLWEEPWLCRLHKNCWLLQQNNWMTEERRSDTQTCHTFETNIYSNNKNRAEGFITFTELFYREDITDAAFLNSNEMSVDKIRQCSQMCIGVLQGLGTITV